jgi:hypothetical protein
VHPDKSIEVKNVKFKENKLIFGKDKEILFKPEHVFLQKRKFPPVWRPCLILQEGKPEPEKISNPAKGVEGLFPEMTYNEISELIKREVAKARMRIKPISLNLFVILLLLHIVEIVMIVLIMRGVRIG